MTEEPRQVTEDSTTEVDGNEGMDELVPKGGNPGACFCVAWVGNGVHLLPLVLLPGSGKEVSTAQQMLRSATRFSSGGSGPRNSQAVSVGELRCPEGASHPCVLERAHGPSAKAQQETCPRVGVSPSPGAPSLVSGSPLVHFRSLI